MKAALTIAGSDSSGGAGIQEDLKVFSALGIYGTTVVTAATAQNTKGIQKIEYLSENIISEQIDSILSDIQIDAAKTGMLCTAKIIDLVYRKIKEYNVENLVVDPVMASTSGTELLELSNSNSLKNLRKLIEISKLATPNVYEAEVLSGIKIKNLGDMKFAARKIGNCIVTGGDFNDNNINEIVDLLFFDNEFYLFKNKKINTNNNIGIHGTGCTFSAAVTSYLAKGSDLLTSVENAEKFTSDLIEHNFSIGKKNGMKILNPNINLNMNSEKFFVIENIQKAVEKLISDKDSYKLSPQVGINIAMALPDAKKIDDAAGI